MKKNYIAIFFIISLFFCETIKFLIFSQYDVFFITTVVVDVINIIVSFLLFKSDKKSIDKLYAYSYYEILYSISLFILIWIESIVCLLWLNSNYQVYFLVAAIIYCIILIKYIVVYKSKEVVQRSIQKTNNSVILWRTYLSKLENVNSSLSDRREYQELIKAFKYSDPINNYNYQLDEEIFRAVDDLINTSNVKLITILIEKIKQRNSIIKVNKQ